MSGNELNSSSGVIFAVSMHLSVSILILSFDKFEDELQPQLPDTTTPEYEQNKDKDEDEGQEPEGETNDSAEEDTETAPAGDDPFAGI